MHADITGQVLKRPGNFQQAANILFLFLALAQNRFRLAGLGQREWLVLHHGDQLRELIAEVVGQVEHSPGVTDHRLRGHRTEGCDLTDGLRTVLFAHIFDDTPALFLTKINIEVGHGDPFRIEKPLKEQGVGDRVNIGDPQRKGHQRSGSGTAPGAYRHIVLFGPVDKIGNDQEVAAEPHLNDRLAFIVDPLRVLGELACTLFLIQTTRRKQDVKT